MIAEAVRAILAAELAAIPALEQIAARERAIRIEHPLGLARAVVGNFIARLLHRCGRSGSAAAAARELTKRFPQGVGFARQMERNRALAAGVAAAESL